VRVSILLYVVLYVVVEVVSARLEAIGWPRLTALDVATAAANACLTVAVGVALLVVADVYGPHWRRRLATRREQRARLPETSTDPAGPITVSSWRPEPLALPAGPSSRTAATTGRPRPGRDAADNGDYAVPARGRPFPQDPGRLL